MALRLRLRRRRRDPTGSMTIIEHLTELRTRLVLSVGAIALGMAIAWPLYGPVFKLLSNPFCSFMTRHPILALDPKHPCSLVFTSVVEPFLVKLKVVFFLGLAI